MDQEKIGNFIKEIRTKNNLTQKQFADKYNVTYQAVSKWENGKNMPDVALIKQISKDFNISLEEIYNGERNINKKKNNFIVYIILLFLIGEREFEPLFVQIAFHVVAQSYPVII